MFPLPMQRQSSAPLPGQSMGAVDLYANDLARRLSVSGSTSEDIISSLRSMNLDDAFWLYSFKVTPCAKTYNHKWTLCPCAHAGETARRRDPRLHPYRAVLCPMAKMKKPCPMGDACMWSHNVFEHWLHPSRFKTRLCSFGPTCNRSICFFAHHPDELRTPPSTGPDADGAARDADEREFLVHLLMAQQQQQGQMQVQMQVQMQQAELLGHGMVGHSGMMVSPPPPPPPQHAAAGLSGFGGSMPMLHGSAPGMVSHAPPMQQATLQQAAMHFGLQPIAASMAQYGGLPPPARMSADGACMPGGRQPVARQLARSTSARSKGNANLDAASLLLGLQESLATLNLTADGSVGSWGDGVGQAGRLSDPGLASHPHVSPIRHLNRISDSGQTLALPAQRSLVDLEVLLSNALAGAAAVGSGPVPSRQSLQGQGSLSPPSSPLSSAQQQQQQQQRQRLVQRKPSFSQSSDPRRPSSSGSPMAASSAPSQSTRAMVQALGGADACVQALIDQLQKQGVTASKDQLVATLSQLLSQLQAHG